MWKTAHFTLSGEKTNKRSLKNCIEDVINLLKDDKIAQKIKHTTYIFENDDFALFPVGLYKEQVQAVIKNGLIKQSLTTISNTNSDAIENAQKLQNKTDSKKKPDKPSYAEVCYGLMQTTNSNGPLNHIKIHLKGGPNLTSDAIKDFTKNNEWDIGSETELQVIQLSSQQDANTFYCEFYTYNKEKFRQYIPTDVIINTWSGRKKPIAMDKRIFIKRFYLKHVRKTVPISDIKTKFSLFVNNIDTVKVVETTPKRLPKINMNFTNYFIELKGSKPGVPIDCGSLFSVIPPNCSLVAWHSKVAPPKQERLLDSAESWKIQRKNIFPTKYALNGHEFECICNMDDPESWDFRDPGEHGTNCRCYTFGDAFRWATALN